ncbi:RIP metalloprotease RseP [Anaerobacillus alkalidiazotrophicus]|uniref:Zinc metalloprotease n=1 Tax=Anaerobacillus alkalidiazotrophicus TaxID=472963 RepID=A0A1S2M039_9BACI|nr:RIP metalloprotease RseP [Anaerobacillus alkalidiazotrophicus]OIJ17870.1 RIP metalloprotease RseP [Anaerobacillus alkalidiazotrophicus]
MNTLISIIIIFGLLVFIHELGHLIFAKRAGILCREFAIGFGPKLFSFKKDETVYTIRLLPLGGFVRMAGEDPEMIEIKPGYQIGLVFTPTGKVKDIVINNKSKYPNARVITVEKIDLEHQLYIQGYDEDNEFRTYYVDPKADYIYDEQRTQIAPHNRQFGSKTLSQRAIAIFAGPFMNFALAAVILMAFSLIQGMPVNKPIVGDVIPDGAAIEAGLQKGDLVVAIDGKPLETWDDLTSVIQKSPNQELTFMINRNGEVFSVAIVPDERIGVNEQKDGFIGVYPPTEFALFGSIMFGLTQTYEYIVLIIESLGMLITGQFTLDHLSGPVGIYNYTGQAAEMGILVLMQWAAILSVNLGIINLLPLPALDGGRLIFIGIEAVRGKPIDPQKEGIVHFVGFALLMLLMLVVTWNDINKFFL